MKYNDLKGINQKSQCFEVIKLIDASEIEAISTTKVLPAVPTIATRTHNKKTVTFEQPKISILVSFFSFINGSHLVSRRYRFLGVCWEFLSRRENYQSKKYKKRVTNRNIKITIKRKKYLTSFYVEKLFLDKRSIDLIY